MSETLDIVDVNDLNARWLVLRDELIEQGSHDAIRTRMHRSLSWMRQAQLCADRKDADGRLINAWIALNALYARWRPASEGPLEEWRVRRDMLEDMVDRDQAGRLQQFLKANRTSCDRLLSEEHLHAFYWADPTPDAARRARSMSRKAGPSYHATDTIDQVLLPLIDRIAMLRSQLVHGQATHGSSVNRALVEPAAELLFGIVLRLLGCIVLDGLWSPDEVWQPVPFPPRDLHFRR